MLLHLLQAMVVGVNEVKGQRSSERATSSAWGHAEKPAKYTNNNQLTQAEKHDTANTKTQSMDRTSALQTRIHYSLIKKHSLLLLGRNKKENSECCCQGVK